MWCSKCKVEYREGFTVCADCGADLNPASSLEQESLPQIPNDTNDQTTSRRAWYPLKQLRGRSKITVALIVVVVLIFVAGFLILLRQDLRQDDPTAIASPEEPRIELTEATEPLEESTPPSPEPEAVPEEPDHDSEPEPEPTEIDSETLAEIVAALSEFPHPGMNLSFPEPEPHFNPTQPEGLGLEIASFIFGINSWWGPPEESFLTPERAPDIFIAWPTYFRTRSLQWHNSELESTYVPELSVLEPRLIYTGESEDFVTLHTHMETTARELFGAQLDMRDIGVGRYTFEFGGYYLYTMGGAFGVPAMYLPIVLGFEHIGDGFYEVSCVFISTADDYFSTDGDELVAYLHTLPRHTIVLQRNDAGGFYYRAHILPEDDLPTAQEVWELLDGIPYTGIRVRWHLDWLEQPIETSETAVRLAVFINMFNHSFTHPPLVSFESPEEAPQEFVFSAAFFGTDRLQWGNPDRSELAQFRPELSAIVPILHPIHFEITLHSHMEETAKMLFGREMEITHRPDEDEWTLFIVYDLFGVSAYSIWGIGLPAGRVPIILSYEETSDGYLVRCVFIWSGDGFSPERREDSQAGRELRPIEELYEYLRTTTDIHTITLRNNPQGGWFYHAHILPE